MRFLLIAVAFMMVLSASDLFAMGKSDGSKEKVEKPLVKSNEVAAATVKKPAEVAIEPKTVKPGADKAVVTVDGHAIKESAVNAKIEEAIKVQMARMPAGANLPPDALKGFRYRMRTDLLDGLVLEYLVDKKLKASKIEVSAKDVGAKIDEIMKMNNITLDQVKEELAKNDVTLDQFKVQLKRNVGIERLIDAEIKAAGESPKVGDEEAKKFYDENKTQFSSPEQVRASHILIKTTKGDEEGNAEAKKKIEDLLKKARAGGDFAALAKENSEDPGSKDKGGEYTFRRGRMVPEFEKAAFSLKVGEVSDVVTTSYGYHIIKLSEKIAAETNSSVLRPRSSGAPGRTRTMARRLSPTGRLM